MHFHWQFGTCGFLCPTTAQLLQLAICAYSRGDGEQLRSPVRVSKDHNMSLFFSSNSHAQPASTQLLPALLMFISTPDMDWTSPDFRKQFRSVVLAGQPQFPQNMTTALPLFLSLNYITSSANNRIHPVPICGILSKRCLVLYIQQLKLKLTYLQ